MTYSRGIICFLATILSLATAVKIDTLSGPVEGYVSALPGIGNVVTSFKGIPYAQPPIGDLRFEKPQPVTPWTETLNASVFSAECIQITPPPPSPQLPQSEDCLTLNIWVPGNLSSTAEKKAVMFWIHGGGLRTGSAIFYDGTILSNHGDVIVVTINYRLNIFGFLNSEGEAPSNVGFWDQHLAIRWVRDNIAAFGGDVSRITIFGESAGSWSVAFQTMSPQNNNTLFQRAIYESGGYLISALSRKDSQVNLFKVAAMVGCHSPLRISAFACLKARSTEEIKAKIISQSNLIFLPVKDNDFIVEDPFKLLSEFALGGADAVKDKVGNLASYDTILGFNSQEGLLGVGTYQFPIIETILGLSQKELVEVTQTVTLSGESLTAERRRLLANMAASQYSRTVPASIANRSMNDQRVRMATDMYGDLRLTWPTVECALLHSAVATNKKTYLYEFDHRRSFRPWIWPEGPDWLRTGSDHSDEISFVFGAVLVDGAVLGQNYTTAEKSLSLAIMTYWTNFAKTGDPKTQTMAHRGAVFWPELYGDSRKYLSFTTDIDIIKSQPLGGRADFWRSAVVASVTTPRTQPEQALPTKVPEPTAAPLENKIINGCTVHNSFVLVSILSVLFLFLIND